MGAFEFLPQLKYGKSNQLHAANVGFFVRSYKCNDLLKYVFVTWPFLGKSNKNLLLSPSKSTLVLGIVGKFPFFFAGKKALLPKKLMVKSIPRDK